MPSQTGQSLCAPSVNDLVLSRPQVSALSCGIFERWLLVEGSDFFRVVLQLAHGCADLGVEIGLVSDRHAANSVSLEVFPDQFIGIAVGRIGRKIKQPQSAVQTLNKRSGLFGNVGGSAINDQENRVLG